MINILEQPKHKSESEWVHLRKFGYAPGDYVTRCRSCDMHIDGVDKRALSCFVCASSKFEAEQDQLATFDVLHETQLICEQVGHGPESLRDILASLVEEVGELAVEIKIKAGLKNPAKGGPDGIVGEAVDVILCALDIIHAETGSITDDQLKMIFNAKLQKWRRSVT